MTKKILVIGAKKDAYTPMRVMQELRRRKLSFDFAKWNQLIFIGDHIYRGNKRIKLKDYSAIFFNSPACGMVVNNPKKRKQRYFLRLSNEAFIITKKAKRLGIRIINHNFSLKYPYYNKFIQGVLFAEKGVRAIKTIHFTKNTPRDINKIIKARGINFPLIGKESSGGMGKKVWKFENYKEMKSFINHKRGINFVFQPFIENDCDYRVLVIGGKSVGIMKRQARKGAWKNNFARGGKVDQYQDPAMEKFAEDACRKVGLEYAGVDVLESKGKYYVIEINLYAMFEGFETTYPEINVAGKIVDLLVKR